VDSRVPVQVVTPFPLLDNVATVAYVDMIASTDAPWARHHLLPRVTGAGIGPAA